MVNTTTNKNENTDSVIRHFILFGIFTIDIITSLFGLIKTEKTTDSDLTENELKESLGSEILANIPDDDLKKALRGTDLLSRFDRDDLISLVISSPDALKNILAQERRQELIKLTKQDLKSRLAGTQQLYKLNKTELVELIIKNEQNQRNQ